jgi:hypothetical protein
MIDDGGNRRWVCSVIRSGIALILGIIIADRSDIALRLGTMIAVITAARREENHEREKNDRFDRSSSEYVRHRETSSSKLNTKSILARSQEYRERKGETRFIRRLISREKTCGNDPMAFFDTPDRSVGDVHPVIVCQEYPAGRLRRAGRAPDMRSAVRTAMWHGQKG